MRRFRLGFVTLVAAMGLVSLPAVAQASTEAVLNIQYQVQETGYWCGPAATRIAMSARTGNLPSQATLAAQLGTTTNGTDWIGQVTGVLNADLGTSWYETKEMPNDPPTQAQRDLLWRDITLDINNGYPIVANIVAPANNHPPGYPNYTIYHYFTVIGYDSSDMTVKIADPASFGGNQIYWLSFDQLATLIPPKGYSA
ncbi:C39 family peptidase [Amycolatopsis eburnea]|uniref:Lysis protein n=1 Tax=Amycolatopsis eburnea TaxID=2267691 RepID=A0A3R9ESR4_9PSEU|nr:C39 family peptidase [Amycolatopsis eburnea]RSD19484.1 lysis protein [Amycolatopsis eburnea]